MEKFPRGSEWRRWDLHIHTPETRKNDQFEGKTKEEKWDKFYKAIDEYIGDGRDLEKNIVAVGITDYLSVDNYIKVINEKKLNTNIKLILPNVEMRMMPMARRTPVNIHCIFNPDIVDELEDRFFGKLRFKYGDSTYSATHSELIRMGRAISNNKKMNEEEAYQLGLEQFIVDISSLAEVFEKDKDLRENTVIVVSNKTDDGASGVITHSDLLSNSGTAQMETARREIYYFSDMIFSAQESDRNYFLGQASDDVKTVIEKYHSLKPCIHGSDAHCNKKLFEPDGGKYCWIKADPTFNGLKQVIYEPDTRVCISSVKPEEKPEYQVIDSIYLGDDKTQKEINPFNDKLTCIIGGKSTGKSLLLHNLAYAIDPEQVRDKAVTTHQNIEGRQLNDVVVSWKDGTKSTDEDASERKIVYIPQTYLNRLSDENEELTEIDEIIKNVVLIDPEAKAADSKMQESIKQQRTNVEHLIYELIQINDDIQAKKNEEAEVGTKAGIQKELKKLNSLKNKLAKNGTITDVEIATYNNSIAELKQLENLISKLIDDIEYFNILDSVVSRKEITHKFDNEDLIAFDSTVDEIIVSADNLWITKRKELINQIEARKKELESKKVKFDSEISSLKPKIEENESIKKISEAIQTEDEKLAKVIAFEKEIEELQNAWNESIDKLISEFFVYHDIRKEYEDTINNKINLYKDGLEFSVDTPFRSDAFIDVIMNLIDNRSLKSNRDWIDTDKMDSEWLTTNNMKRLVEECLNGNLKFTKKRTAESALREILADWNNTTYKVCMDGDSIEEMSPGKKALVLLKLLINLAESRCPILIDQPEDDLDNRSVFDELIPFIKKKKLQRQIIIVTHNANVVLGGDAEEVIVANQDGKNTPNKVYKFEYRTGSIEEDRAIDDSCILNSRGIQQHICDILEGGEKAFDLRKNKYQI